MVKAKKPSAPKENLFLLTGENDFELQKFLKNWEKAAREKYGDFSVLRIDFFDKKNGDILGEIQTPPFFGAEKRIFFLENFPPPPPSYPFSAEKKAEIEAMTIVLSNLSEETVVVCAVAKPDRRTSSWKTLEKCFGKIQTFSAFEKITSGALSAAGRKAATDFVLKSVAEKKGKILPSAATFLVDFAGSDPWKLDREIGKLVCFSSARKKPISEDDISKMVVPSGEMENFAFSAAIQSGNKVKVFAIIEHLLHSGEAPQAILARDAAPTIRQLIAVKNARNAAESGVHPFVFGKMKSAAERFSLEKLLAAHAALLRIDRESKTGKLPITPDKTELFRLAMERIFADLYGE